MLNMASATALTSGLGWTKEEERRREELRQEIRRERKGMKLTPVVTVAA